MTVNFESVTKPAAGDAIRTQTTLAVGGLLGALAASSCCILPVVLFSLGIGGAWIGNFTQLAPYKPYFVVVTVAFLGAGYRRVTARRSSSATSATHANGRCQIGSCSAF